MKPLRYEHGERPILLPIHHHHVPSCRPYFVKGIIVCSIKALPENWSGHTKLIILHCIIKYYIQYNSEDTLIWPWIDD